MEASFSPQKTSLEGWERQHSKDWGGRKGSRFGIALVDTSLDINDDGESDLLSSTVVASGIKQDDVIILNTISEEAADSGIARVMNLQQVVHCNTPDPNFCSPKHMRCSGG